MTVVDAIQQGNLEALKEALQQDPTQANAKTADGISALLLTLYYRRSGYADLLLSAGAEIDCWSAAALGRTDLLGRMLTSRPSLVNEYSLDGWTLLHLAAFFGQAEAARLMLERGAAADVRSTNAMANLPLHAAAAGRHTELVKTLLQAGSLVDATQRGGYTALHGAVQNGDLATVRLLLAHGASIAAKTDDGRTAMDLALAAGHEEVAALLLAK